MDMEEPSRRASEAVRSYEGESQHLGVSRPAGKQTTSQLPLSRVKNIIKSDPDITLASQEATLVISKATELFVRHLSRQSHIFTVRAKRKTIQRRDVIACLPQRDEFAFLEGTID